MEPRSDAGLHLVGPGDAEATEGDWETVYRDHVVPVFRYVYARTGNRADAEDVTSQVFERALPRLRLRASIGEVRNYLLVTSRTVLADHWATRYGVQTAELDDERVSLAVITPGGSDVAGTQTTHRAHELLGRLPENYRRVLELRFLRGCSVRETAHEMGISVANAKVLQWRALRRAAQLEEAPA
jgi:RNA polymerase sigma-70 factor (ECF subfamily)